MRTEQSAFSTVTWRKSSSCEDDDGCVGSGTCVEVARLAPDRIGVRDSKDPDGPVLSFGIAAWRELLAVVKGEGSG